jgi:hypothetical protein
LREDVPFEELDEATAKQARIRGAFGVLREKVAQAEPDVFIVFGDDQLECFDFNNYPPFMVYVGEEFQGTLSASDAYYTASGERPKTPLKTMKGHPGLATNLLTGLMHRGIDPAWAMDMPKPDKGIGHAVMRPAESVTDLNTPVVPVLVNCYFAPQVTAKRCYQLGRAVREIIDEYPEDIRVAVLGSGGLWHTPGAKDAYLDEDFDRGELAFMEAGDARGMAEFFDAYPAPHDDRSQPVTSAPHSPPLPASPARRAVRVRSATGSSPAPSPTGRGNHGLRAGLLPVGAVADGRTQRSSASMDLARRRKARCRSSRSAPDILGAEIKRRQRAWSTMAASN